MELEKRVREGLRQRMMEIDWLDDETRQLSIEKVSNIRELVLSVWMVPTCPLVETSMLNCNGKYENSTTNLETSPSPPLFSTANSLFS